MKHMYILLCISGFVIAGENNNDEIKEKENFAAFETMSAELLNLNEYVKDVNNQIVYPESVDFQDFHYEEPSLLKRCCHCAIF